MAHQAKIGGTNYEVSGGKTLIGGTAYKIIYGKTLIDGTVHPILFVTTPEVDTITFYLEVDGDYGVAGTYEALWPMTWAEWCDSSYNDDSGIYMRDDYPTAGHGTCVYDSNWVEQSGSDVISPEETYIIAE